MPESTFAGRTGHRIYAAEDFFLGPSTTALDDDEIVTEIVLPALPLRCGWGFEEFSLRTGDFAYAAAAAPRALRDGDCCGSADRSHGRRRDAGHADDSEAISQAKCSRRIIVRCGRRLRQRIGQPEFRPPGLRRLSPSSGRRADGACATRRLATRSGAVMTRKLRIVRWSTAAADRAFGRAASAAVRFPAQDAWAYWNACRVRTWRVRRLHGDDRWSQRAGLPDVCRAGWTAPRSRPSRASARSDKLSPLQEAFREHHALQCGFCTPGMLMTCVDMLQKYPLATDDEIREALSGNLCRCTGYEHIVRAVRRRPPRGRQVVMKMHVLSGGRLRMRKSIFLPDAAARRRLSCRSPLSAAAPAGKRAVRHRMPSLRR